MLESTPIVVIGAGMAGLACARTLVAHDRPVMVLESTERIGGRLGSDRRDGFCCDRGFQVSMSNYTALESLVPRDQVVRHAFIPGAVVWTGRKRIRAIDPKRAPWSAWQPLVRGLVGLRDLRAIQRCRRWARRVTAGQTHPGTATSVIKQAGFRGRFLETFLRPFFGGVFLDESLSVSADRFLRTIRRFDSGQAELPAGGMQQLAEGMAEPIRPYIRLGSEVTGLDSHRTVSLAGGEKITASHIVLATAFDQVARILGRSLEVQADGWSGTMAFHFSAPEPVLREPVIVLNGSGTGMVNLVCSPSAVAPGYGPEGLHTILVSLRPFTGGAPQVDVETIRDEAAHMLGVDGNTWTWIRNSIVSRGLPRIAPGSVAVDLPPGTWIAGDWQGDPSLETAVQRGIDIAHEIIAEHSTPTK